MAEWNESQNEFIENLEKTEGAFDNILTKDPSGLVIGGEERDKLVELAKRNKKVLHKLKSEEFTVAVVGLEKAGKSTLGNALLKNMVLPEYTERCTYTTTEIRAGEEDSGEIFFYGYDEFQNNFNEMLKTIKYEGKADFTTLDVNTFDSFWSSMESKDPAIFNLYNGTTVEDIREILKGSREIKPLLGTGSRKFVGKEQLQSNEFQRFITGINGFSADGRVERTAHPYAVKAVNIKSTELGDMRHIVLYDVPGFDSPTELHKAQTKKMLQEADAIILVTNVGDRPNLTGPQLDMLRTSYDDDGIMLSEKAFVFGNKVDRAGNEEQAKGNMAALRNDAVNKYRISINNHIFFGSAKAFLEKNNLRSQDEMRRGMVNANENLEKWGLSDGINELYSSMQDYYRNDRYEVLRKRAEKTIDDAKNFLHDVLDKYKISEEVDNRSFELAIECTRRLATYAKAVHDMAKEATTRINKEKPFSNIIVEDISSEQIFKDITSDDDIVENAKKARKLGTDEVFPDGAIDKDIRESLSTKLTKELLKRAGEETGKKETEIYDALADKLLEIFAVSKDSRYYAELKESIPPIFDKIKIANNGESCRFNTLIKRFSGNLIEAVILHSFASTERLYKIKDENLPEFFSLATYYTAKTGKFGQDIDLENDNARLKIFSQMLAHGEAGESDIANTEDSLKKFFEENKEYINFALDMLPINGWARRIVKAGLGFNATDDKNRVKQAIENAFFDLKWDKSNTDVKKILLDNSINKICQANEVAAPLKGGLLATLKALQEEAENKQKSAKAKIDETSETSEAKNDALEKLVIDTINEDMANLRDITVNAVVKATNLEQAFISVITDNIEYIREEAEKEKGGLFDLWLSENLGKIKSNEIAIINRDKMEAETRKNIIANIESVLKEIKI